ncbi:MAG TPA: hypothetical protein VFX48_08120, partial [Saprospiraceae bacterium]|nr:hypothetical protein [Saprospiraceae bacterium]
MGPQELLLSSNKIQIQGTSNLENKLDLSEQLSTLYKQNPNRNFFLFIPREWLYYKYANKKKQNWITKTLARQSEKPAIVDTSLCRATQNNIHNYLYNQGFFNATGSYTIKKKKHKAQVIYQVQPGDRYLINDIQFVADDTAVLELLLKNQGSSFLQPGRPLDNSLFQNEKARISELMFNHGYIEFNPLYIQTLEADTVHLKANIKLHVVNPEGKRQHPIYLVNRIEVNRNYNPNDSTTTSQSIWYDSIQMPDESRFQLIRPKVIASKIKFRTGDIANKSLVDETYGQLSKLGIYRFVSIEAQKDSMLNHQLNYKILLTPYKRWVFDYGTDLNYTSIKTASKTLFGISGFVHLKNRNLFHGAESFSTKVEIGTELNLFKINDFNSLNIHYSNELSLPAFHDLSGTWHIAKSIFRPIKKYTNPPDSRTNIKFGLDYENLVRLYQ